MAHDRRWLPPSKVRSLVQAARRRGYVRAAGAHAYELGDELGGLRLPVDFHPDLGALDAAMSDEPSGAAPVPLFRRLVKFISEATQESEAQVVAALNQIQQDSGGLLRAEVAALVLARLRDLDVSGFYDEVESSLHVAPIVVGQM